MDVTPVHPFCTVYLKVSCNNPYPHVLAGCKARALPPRRGNPIYYCRPNNSRNEQTKDNSRESKPRLKNNKRKKTKQKKPLESKPR